MYNNQDYLNILDNLKVFLRKEMASNIKLLFKGTKSNKIFKFKSTKKKYIYVTKRHKL